MYRILLPSLLVLEPKELARTVMQLPHATSVEAGSSWEVGSLPEADGHPAGTHAEVLLLSTEEVHQERSEAYFYAPQGVRCWVEVRALGTLTDRVSRLKARLVALHLSQQLNLPVLETRNGVMCTTPEAFAAWCARQPHPNVQRIGGWEHVTAIPLKARIINGVSDHDPATRAPMPVVEKRTPPPARWWMRTWRRLRGEQPFIVTLPTTSLSLAQALLRELSNTFSQHTAAYEPEHNRIVIRATARTSQLADDAPDAGRRFCTPTVLPTTPTCDS